MKRNDSVQSKASSFSTPAHNRQKSVGTKSDAGSLSKSPAAKGADRRASVMVPPKSSSLQASAGNSPSGKERSMSIKPQLSANDVDSVQSDISTKIGYLTMDPRSGLAGGLN